MKIIKCYIEDLDEELCGAKHYAEKYVESKAYNKADRANKYREMATDELKHAGYIHDMVVAEIKTIGEVFQAPEEMQEQWDKAHTRYIEKYAWIKQILAM